MGGRGKLLLAAALLLPMLAPFGAADHCETDLQIFGRSSTTPGIVAPTGRVAAECLFVPGGVAHHAVHTLAPATQQVMVRLYVDVGVSYPHFPVRLEGFGWNNQVFVMERVVGAADAYYTLPEWIYAPDPYDGSTLRASVRLPGGNEVSTEYHAFPVTVMTNLGH